MVHSAVLSLLLALNEGGWCWCALLADGQSQHNITTQGECPITDLSAQPVLRPALNHTRADVRAPRAATHRHRLLDFSTQAKLSVFICSPYMSCWNVLSGLSVFRCRLSSETCRKHQNRWQFWLWTHSPKLAPRWQSESEDVKICFSVSGQESESLPGPEVLLFSCKQVRYRINNQSPKSETDVSLFLN